jgi:cell shape-determining protein MreC
MQKIAAENEVLARENALLKSKLNITESMKYKAVVSNIVHDNSFIGSQSFITRNSDGEIRVGSVVVSNTGFLLGMITEVAGGYAKIQSVQDSNSNIPVRIAGTDVFGFLQGYGNKDPKLRFLSDGDFAAEEGMFLITSGVKGNVPDGIPVGTVKRSAGGEIAVGLGAEMGRQESVIILLFDADKKYE